MDFINLQHPIRWLFLFHALLGTAALLILLIPMLTKKGGKAHVRSGWIYTIAMIGVGVSALVMTPWRVLGDVNRTPSTQAMAVFLFFVAIFTLNSLWYGITVLKFKNRMAPNRTLARILPPVLVVLFGLAIQIFGISIGNVLLMIFPILGYVTAKNQLQYWLKPPTIKRHWWYAHMDGMFAASIATVTAFLVTAVPKMTEHPLARSPLLWVAPGIIGGVILHRWKKSYTSTFSRAG